MPRRLVIFALMAVTVVAFVVFASAAQAEIRHATVQDPQDATPTVSGVPNNPDISQVLATYDSTGTLTITVSFYNPLNALDTSQNFAFYATFGVSTGTESVFEPGGCTSTAAAGNLDGQHHVYSRVGTAFYNRATVDGYSGFLDFTRTTAPDQRSVTITASSPTLANRDYRCIWYYLNAEVRSTFSNPDSEYSVPCDCWYVTTNLDYIGSSTIGWVWFDGFKPSPKIEPPTGTPPTGTPPSTPPPTLPPPKKNSWIFAGFRSKGCHAIRLTSWNVGPDWVDGAIEPINGEIVAHIGQQYKRFPAERKRPIVFNNLSSGYHNLLVHYKGDEWRKPSDQHEITVYVPQCHHRHSR